MTQPLSSGATLRSAEITDPSANTPTSLASALLVAKDVGSVAWRFTQTVLKRLPDVTDGNPVKTALGIVKLIIEITDVCQKPFALFFD